MKTTVKKVIEAHEVKVGDKTPAGEVTVHTASGGYFFIRLRGDDETYKLRPHELVTVIEEVESDDEVFQAAAREQDMLTDMMIRQECGLKVLQELVGVGFRMGQIVRPDQVGEVASWLAECKESIMHYATAEAVLSAKKATIH